MFSIKTKEDYEKELSILDGIKKCVLRYADSVSTDKDEIQSDWCQEYIGYLRNRESKIRNKIRKLEK